MRAFFARIMIVAAVFMVGAFSSRACDVPVFRYALERWEPDPYYVVVFHEGQLDAEGHAAVDVLRRAESQGGANLQVRLVDVSGEMDDGLQSLRDRQAGDDLPCMTLLYPTSKLGDRVAWSGPLNRAAATAVTDSPARRTIAERIIDGQTGVWVLIEPPDESDDRDAPAASVPETAAGTIEKALAVMPDQLSLPPELMEAAPHLTSRLRIEFSMVRLSRDDPAEAVLIAMLLGSEDDLRTVYGDQAVAIPVYGRGRMLMAMVGAGIVPENIQIACRSLVGRCTCEIKEQHIGIDLLFKHRWRDSLEVSLVDMVELPLPIAEPSVQETPVDPVGDDQVIMATGGMPTLFRNLLIFGGILAAAMLLSLALMLKRNGRKSR